MIDIHGITPEMVCNAPCFDDIWSSIRPYFNSLVIAHNAFFDISVLKHSLAFYRPPNFKYVDSISIATHFVSGSKSLEHCAECLEVPLQQHHNALEDASVCAKIVLSCLKKSEFDNIGQLCFAFENVKIHSFSDATSKGTFSSHQNEPKKSKSYPSYSNIRLGDIVPEPRSIDINHPLYQKNIVFTGELTIDRKTAAQLAVNAGALVKSSLSSKTHYLVVGMQDVSIVGKSGQSSKEKKAHELNASGKGHIEIIDEYMFLQLLQKGQEG